MAADEFPVLARSYWHPVPGESPAEWWTSTGYQSAVDEAARLGGGKTGHEDLLISFYNGVPRPLAEEALRRAGRGESSVVWNTPWPLGAWPEVPTRFVLCRDDRFFPAPFMRRLARERLGAGADEIGGCHCAALSRPAELAGLLESYPGLRSMRGAVKAGGEKGAKMTSSEKAASDPAARGGGDGPEFDPSVAHQARIYDYLLGGKDNYAADREAADEMARIWPQVAFTARANRAFLGRAVRYLAGEAGIRQFLDLGTGIPAAGNTHQVAQSVVPEARVAYVDYDPLVLAYAEALMASGEAGAIGYIHADIRDTDTVLDRAAELLDFTEPVAVTMLAILHVIGDSDRPYDVVARLLDAVPSGSYLVISHAGSDLFDQEELERVMAITGRRMRQKGVLRTRAQVTRFFDGTDLVEPGLVRVEEWRPDSATIESNKSTWWCAVGRKR